MSKASPPESRRRGDCPICASPAAPAHAPFCSRGCRDRDLLKWLGDGYRVPGPPALDPSGEDASSGLDSEVQPPL
ncbi:MAG: DNA gyrase inhibitor YacG [Allosphingosinicella sp.]